MFEDKGSQSPSTQAGPASLNQAEGEDPADFTRILLISDIHANWSALQAALDHAAGDYETIWFLGDLLGYGPNPVACAEFVRHQLSPAQWRVGNHDLGVLERLNGADWGATAAHTLLCHRDIVQREADLWAWLQEEVHLERGGPMHKVNGRSEQVLTHANLENDMEYYLFPDDGWKIEETLVNLRQRLSHPDRTGWLLVGHSHIPCLFRLRTDPSGKTAAKAESILWGEPISIAEGHYYINPGSVGQPRDGNPDACYVILDLAEQTATWHRVAYDIETVVNQMRYLYQGQAGHKPLQTLISMLRYGGSANTELRMIPVYRQEQHGLIAK